MEHDISHIKDIGDIMNIFFNSRIYTNQSFVNALFGKQQKTTRSQDAGCSGTRDTLTISASGKEKLVKNTKGRTHNTNVDKSIDLKSYIASAQKTNQKIIDNAALPLVLHGMKKKEAREKAQTYFKDFGLEGTEYQYPSQLSGGMRQRAALLRTYLSSNGVALLDEPFSALDTITKTAIHKWYLEVMQHIDLSTIFITHDIDEAILLSDRIYILNGKPGEIRDEIVIKEKKPRAEDFYLTDQFLAYKRKIIAKL